MKKRISVVKAWALTHEDYILPTSIFYRRKEARKACNKWNKIIPVLISPINKPKK